MITYVYWIFVLAVVGGCLFLVGVKAQNWKGALIACGCILLVSWLSYYFGLQQVFVKKFGGVMTIQVPEGYNHISTTWKDNNLWVENYDPKTNTCIFSEYSKGSVLEGRVFIKNCNPLKR